MARLDPRESQEALKERVTKAIHQSFPIKGSAQTLRVTGVEVTDEPDTHDVRTQKEKKLAGRTFGSVVKASFELVDNKTGKVVDTSTRRVATLPQITRRYSYIVNGTEYQTDNLWTLRPGVYSRVKQNGELESQINIRGGSYHLDFDPGKRKFKMRIGGSNPPLYSVMQALGVGDKALEKKWGREIFAANKVDQKKVEQDIIRLAGKINPRAKATTFEDASQVIRDRFEGAELDPEVTKKTLGKPIKTLGPVAMMETSSNLLKVSRGEREPDNRESLQFKQLQGVEDFISNRIKEQKPIIERRVLNNLDRKGKIKDIVGTDYFNRPINQFFAKSSLANQADDTNPVAMVGGQQKTTVVGTEGGIQSEHKLTEEVKLVDPSHLGFLDPLHTPEGPKTGVTLHTALGMRKEKGSITIPLYNTKTGKVERVDPATAQEKVVVMADEVTWGKDGKPTPKRDQLKASLKEGKMGLTSMKKADYVMPSAAQMFSLPLNMVPFLGNNSQNRVTMSGRHQEQAVSLKYREAPLVQSVQGGKSFDDVMGSFTAQTAPLAGEVVGVEKDSIKIKGADGKVKDVPIYDNYPLNEKKGVLNSEPQVKVGDTVKEGQLIADTNFSKGGTYAPGVNLRVAYLPAKGHNVEDGIVISESAARQLTSEHLYKKGFHKAEGELKGKKSYVANFPQRMTVKQQEKLGDDGVIKVGQRVEPGDTLIAGMTKRVVRKGEMDLGRIHKSLLRTYDDKGQVWDQDFPGEVVEVTKSRDGVKVHVKTEEPAQVGDKIVSRHANKGIVVRVTPDSEMPQTKDGKPIQVLHNPLGVMGRMNVGQILETAAGKIAEKEGKPFKVQNFALDDARGEVKAALKKAELSDTENLIDPKTGKEIPNVMTGQQYTLKLHHQVDQKMTARSRASYDRNLAPRSGHPHGGQAMGQMELYSLLSHGAVHNIREMATYKADRGQHGDNDELWGALQAGELLPPPKPTFAFKKFEGMLKTVGVNVEKEGNSLNLLPLTDKQVLETSSGAIKDGGKSVKAGTLDPEKGGLFDPETTGGTEGKKWSHITLHEPMPNPLFEGAISSLTGVDRKEYQKVINGEKGVTADGKLVDADVEGAQYGPSAVGRLLKNVDIDKELEAERGRIGKLRGTPLNKANRRIKYLSALKKAKLSPTEAYMTKHVPVMPPVMRPMSVSGDGSIQFEDVNQFYKHISLTNQKLRTMHKGLPDEERAPLRRELYDEMKSLTGLGGTLNRDYPGILDVIAGANPKTGFYQRKLIKKRQDMTMRSTIVPEPSLSLDEVGIPRKAAMEMYKPFVVREIRNSFGLTPMQAKQEIQQNTAIANKALERAAEQRPVLLKRDPVLHKHGVQAFKPRLTEGKAIQIHPLVTSSYGADFDGDTMAAFVPMTNEAVEEAEKMKPSNILFSPASGKVAYTPIKEMQVGLYNLTEVGKQSNLKFSNQADLEKAVKQGKLDVTDVAQVGGKKTTLGRLQLHATLPKDMQDEKILSDFKYRFDKKEQGKTYQQMAELDPKSYARRVDRLKDLGNERAYFMGYTVGLDDLKVHRDVRDPVLKKARERTAGLNMEKEEDAKKLVSVYADALTEIETKVKGKAQKGLTNLDRTERSAGIKGNGYRQLTAAPVLYEDAQGRPVPSPVERSYSEGLSSADYWASVSGGRKGIIQKVQSVSEPGYLSKRLVNASMNQLVDSADCKTDAGIALSTDESDILGRHTQLDIKVGDGVIPAGTLLKPEHLSQMRKAKVPKVVVRSPMRCAHTNGVCQKCLGLSETGQLYDEGTNIGVLASQSLGERGTQLQMRQFHAGGVMAPAGQKKALDDFGRSNELLNLTQKLKGSAVLASTGGTVQSIKKDPAGGWNVMVAGRRHYVRANRKLNIKKGDRVKKGMPLTGGPVNPHELLPLTNVNTVQNYLADELNSIYSAEGVKRRHSEVVVRTMTNNARVVDPGDSIDVVRNDQVPLGTIQQINRGELKGKKPIKYEPMIKGVGQIPLDLQEDWLARLNHENLKSTVIEGAQRGWVSDLHGAHPVPGLAYGAEFGKGKKGPY
jgi:DNA-directed RNA polymerase subunit beta'